MSAVSEAAKAHNNALHRESYEWYKAHGLCQNCRRGYAEPGRAYCKPCYKLILARREKNDPGRVKRNAYCAERRARLKAEGKCVDCGKRNAAEGRIRCATCLRKMGESRVKYRINQELKSGRESR